MSTDKVASVGLVLRPQGFVAGMRDAKGRFLKDAAAMKGAVGALGAEVSKQVKVTKEIAKVLSQAPQGSGMFSWLKRLGAEARDTAKKIGGYFQEAFKGGGRGGGGGDFKAGALIAYDQMKKLATLATDTMRDVNSTHERAMQLSVNARKGGGGYVAPGQLEAQAYATAAEVKGTTADQALDAMSAFVTLTGDLKTAQSSISTFALASKASGADMKDVAEATASISKQFGIVDPKQIKDVLAAMIYQGKEGAIMLPEMASGLQKIAAAGAAFGVSKDVGGVRKLGGLVQMARGGTGSAEQAFTAVEAVFRGLTEKGKELKAQHVNVYEGHGASKHTRSIDDILVDVVSKAGGKDIGKKTAAISQIFGSEGMRAISPMVGIYQNAFANAKGQGGGPATDAERTAAGVEALRKALGDLTHAAGTWGDVQDDAAKMQEASSAKMTAAWEAFKGKLSASVMPALGRLADKLSDGDAGVDTFATSVEMAVEALGGLVDFLKSAGLVKEKTTFEKAIDKAKKAQSLEAQAADTWTEWKEALKSDPKKAAKLEKKYDQLTADAAAARADEEDLKTKSISEGTAAMKEDKYHGGILERGGLLDRMFGLRDEAATDADVKRYTGDARKQIEKATAPYAEEPRGTPGAPSTVKLDGGVKISGQNAPLRVHITGDDSKRGAGPAAPAGGTRSRG